MTYKNKTNKQEDDFDLTMENYFDKIRIYESNIVLSFETLISQAIKKEALIELCALLYSAIEQKLIIKIYEQKLNKLRQEYILKLRKNNIKRPVYPEEELKIRKLVEKEIKDIWNISTNHHLIYYTNISKKSKLICKKMFEKISIFNENRNNIIHKLLIPELKMKYFDIIDIAKEGREIQLILNKNYTEKQIKKEINKIEKIRPQTILNKSILNYPSKKSH